jgi:hypothetical protein
MAKNSGNKKTKSSGPKTRGKENWKKRKGGGRAALGK